MQKYINKRKKLLSIDGGSIQERSDENDVSESKDRSSAAGSRIFDHQSGLLVNCESDYSDNSPVSKRR